MKNLTRLAATASILVLLSACWPARTAPGDEQGSSSAMMRSSLSSLRSSSRVSSARSAVSSVVSVSSTASLSSAQAAAPRVIVVTVENWKFSPSVIRVKKGEKVTVRLKGIAGNHGFAVPGLSINTQIAAGQTVDVTIPTDTPGTYAFFCSVPCGIGHKDMKGTIIIE